MQISKENERQREIVTSPQFGANIEVRAPSPRFESERIDSPPAAARDWRQTQQRDNELVGQCERHFSADLLDLQQSQFFPFDYSQNYLESTIEVVAGQLLIGGKPNKLVVELELDTVMLVTAIRLTINGHFPFRLLKAESVNNIYPLSGEEDPDPHYLPLMPLRKLKDTVVPCQGVATKLKLTFLGAQRSSDEQSEDGYELEELEELDREVALISKKARGSVAGESERGEPRVHFKKALERITVQGLECHRVPAASNVIGLFNCAHQFKAKGYEQECIETDMLVGMALMNSRRYVQACEVFRKIECELLQRIATVQQDSMCSTAHAASTALSTFLSKAALLKNPRSSFILMTAAKLEILIAECMNSHSQLSQKLEALKRAYLFVVGSPPRQACFFATSNHYYHEDSNTTLLKLQPVLLQFLLQRMRDQNESVRVAVLRTVQFTLDVLGCQVDQLILQILRALISTFPGAPAELVSSFSLVPLPSSSSLPANFQQQNPPHRQHPEFSHFLGGVYAHLFQTLLSTVNSASSSLLQHLFHDIIAPLTHSFRVCSTRPPEQLVSFVYRISRKILAYCALDLPPSYLSDLIALLSSAHLSSSAKLLLRIPPRSPAQSSLWNLWNTVRIKYLLHINPTQQLCTWLATQLQQQEVRGQMEQHHSPFFYYLQVILLLSRRASSAPLLPFYAQYKEATAAMFCIPNDQSDRMVPPSALLNISQRQDEDEQQSQIPQKRQSQEVQLQFIELLNPLKMALQEAKLRNNFVAFQLTWVSYSQLFQRLPKQASAVLFSSAKKYLGEIKQYLEENGVAHLQTLKLLLQMLPSLAFSLLRTPDPSFIEFLRLFFLTFVKESIPCNVADEAFLVLGLLLDCFSALQKHHCRQILQISSQKLYLRGKEVIDRAVHNEMVLQALRDRNVFTRDMIRTTVLALTDKFTAKSSQQKDTVAQFISIMLATHKAPSPPKIIPPRNDERLSPDDRRALDGTLDLEFQSQEICGGDWDSNNSLRAAFDPDFFLREVQERTLIRFQDLVTVSFLENEFTLKPRISGGSMLSDNRKSALESRKSALDGKAGKSVAVAFKRNFEQLQEGGRKGSSFNRRGEPDKKQQLQVHQQEQQRIDFFLHILKALKSEHKPLLQYVLYLKQFRYACLRLLESGHLSLRLKVYEIMNLLCDKLTTGEIEPPSRDQLALGQLLIGVTNFSFTKHPNDASLHFQNFQLLLRLFKDVLPPQCWNYSPVPPLPSLTSLYSPLYNDEIIRTDQLDLESIDLMIDMPELDRKKYACLRALLVTKQWSYIHDKGVLSPWANMRSLSYTLLNVIFKIELKECTPSLRQRLLGLIIPLLSSLLAGKESDSNAGGLNILGALCGLQGSLEGKLKLDRFKGNAAFVNEDIWARVFELSHDPDLTLRDAAQLLIQLSAPREQIERLYQKIKEEERIRLKTALLKLQQPEEQRQQPGDMKLIGQFEQLMLAEPDYSDHISPLEGYTLVKEESSSSQSYEFYIDRLNEEEVKDKLRLFKNDYMAPRGLWVEGPSQFKRLSVMGGSFEFIGTQSHLLASQFFDQPAQVSAIDPPQEQLQHRPIKDYQEEVEAQGLMALVINDKEEEKKEEENKENEWEAAGVKEIDEDDDTVLQHIDDANLPILKGRRLDSPTFDVPQTGGFCIKLEGGETPDFEKSSEEKAEDVKQDTQSEEEEVDKLDQIMGELKDSPQFGGGATGGGRRSQESEDTPIHPQEEEEEEEEPSSPPPDPMSQPSSDDFQQTGLSPAYSVPGESQPQDAQKVQGMLNHSFEGLSVSIQNTPKVVMKGKCASEIIPPTSEHIYEEKKCFTNPRSQNISHSSDSSSPPTRTALSATAKPDQLFKQGAGIFVLQLEEGEGLLAESIKASSVSPKSRSLLRPDPILWKPLMKPTQKCDAIRIGDCSPKRRSSVRGRGTVALKPRITSYHNPSQRLTPESIKPQSDTTGLVLSPTVTRKEGMIATLNRNEAFSSIMNGNKRDSNSRLTLPPNFQRLLSEPEL